jgi:hypothetical protein
MTKDTAPATAEHGIVATRLGELTGLSCASGR